MKRERRPTRGLWLGLWMAISLLAIVALFRLLDISLLQLLDNLETAPWWLYAATILLTFANQLIGAVKWRRATRWLTPDAPPVAIARLVEATTAGSFLGQFLPLQLSVPLGRWLTLRGDSAGWVVRSSIYEQIFDLVALLSAGMAGLFIVLFTPDATSVTAVFGLVAVACMAGLRIFFRFGARAFHWIGEKRGASGFFGRMAEVLDRAGSASAGTLVTLLGWSFARLVAVALRAVVVALVFVPKVPPALVAAAYPATGLVTALPIAPAGFGVAEWSWTGLLVLLGASAPAAAVAALAFRVMNMIALVLLSAGVLALSMIRGWH